MSTSECGSDHSCCYGMRLLPDRDRQAEALADALFSLDEPWRGRFLELVARIATGADRRDQPPEREQVAAWLGDPALYRNVIALLTEWPTPGS